MGKGEEMQRDRDRDVMWGAEIRQQESDSDNL